MTDQRPLVSVIVPVHNGERYVGAALDSIAAQSYAPLEVIVIDDGSTDRTDRAVLGRPIAVRYVRQHQQGPAAARNRGLQVAGGEVVSFLDADDQWPEGRLVHHVELLISDPAIDLVIGPSRIVRWDEDSAGPVPVLPVPIVQHQVGSATYRSPVFQRVGLFNPALSIGEDKEWFQRALDRDISICVTSEVALDYFVRNDSVTGGSRGYETGLTRALRAHLRSRQTSEG